MEDLQKAPAWLVGPSELHGEVALSGAKNSALRMLAVSLLTDEPIVLRNSPNRILDIKVHIEMLKALNKHVETEGDQIVISQRRPTRTRLEWDRRSIRNTLLIFSALLARFGRASVPLPGGCDIGPRPFDLHKTILQNMGADVWVDDGYLHGSARLPLKAGTVNLPVPSTGATETALIAGSVASGRTRIVGAHVTPELRNLIGLMRKMGAHVNIRSDAHIEVEGRAILHGAQHKVIYDNVEAVTFAIAAAITGGCIYIHKFPVHYLRDTLYKLSKIGLEIRFERKGILVRGRRGDNEAYNPFDVTAGRYPALYSDMQPLFSALALFARGTCSIRDTRWPNRFGYAHELEKMGANLSVYRGQLIVNGGRLLHGARMAALDIRGGAAIVLSALGASSESVVDACWQITRGYQCFAEKLTRLGATIFPLAVEHE